MANAVFHLHYLAGGDLSLPVPSMDLKDTVQRHSKLVDHNVMLTEPELLKSLAQPGWQVVVVLYYFEAYPYSYIIFSQSKRACHAYTSKNVFPLGKLRKRGQLSCVFFVVSFLSISIKVFLVPL